MKSVDSREFLLDPEADWVSGDTPAGQTKMHLRRPRRLRANSLSTQWRRRLGRMCFPVFFCVLWQIPASALSNEAGQFERVGETDGLSHNSVFAILQDRQGFLWIGTADGLNRFDGRKFAVLRHDPADPNSLVSSVVQALLEDQSGNFWVGTALGLDLYDRGSGRFIHMILDRPDAPQRRPDVRVLFEDSFGRIWVGLKNGVLVREPGDDRFKLFRHNPLDSSSLAEGSSVSIQQDKEGGVWVQTVEWGFSPATLNLFDEETRSFQRFVAPEGWSRCGGFVADEFGRFWINVAGLGAFDPRSGEYSGRFFGLSSVALARPYLDSRGQLWIPTQGGLYVVDPEKVEKTVYQLSKTDEFLSDLAMTVTQDSAGTVWAGSRGGLFKLDPFRKKFFHWKYQDGDDCGLQGRQVSCLHEDRSGAIWVGTFGAGLSRLDEGAECFVNYRNEPGDPQSLCSDVVWDIFEDREGVLWLGVENGLCRYSPETDSFELSSNLGFPSEHGDLDRVTAVVEDSEGTLWLGSGFMLGRFDKESKKVVPVAFEDGKPFFIAVNRLRVSGDSSLWIGGATERPAFHRLDLETGVLSRNLIGGAGIQLEGDGVLDFLQDPSGIFWLATSAGLVRYNLGNDSLDLLTTHDGLPGTSVFSLLKDTTGIFWLGTNRGLSRFDPREALGSQFENFGSADGVVPIEFNRHAVLEGRDGTFYFGGMDGIVAFSPSEIVGNSFVPPVALTKVRISGRDGAREIEPFGLTSLELPYNENNLYFEFAALSYTTSADNRFSYRMLGRDQHWVDGETVGAARYAHLPPGKYTFQVKACNNDGKWNENGLALKIRIIPPMWKSWWGRTILAVLGVAAAFGVYRYRVAQLLNLERLRWRIAGDLHDDLSSDLSGIALSAALLRRKGRLPPEELERLKEIEAASQGIVERLRDIVWCVNPVHDSLAAIARRMRTVTTGLLPEADCRFDFDLPSRAPGLPMAIRRDIFLIFKEAIHNIARHADAKEINTRFRLRNNTLTLEVRDDGKGFDPNTVAIGEGLARMKHRARTIGGRLAITGRPGEGTVITLELDMANYRGGGAPVPFVE